MSNHSFKVKCPWIQNLSLILLQAGLHVVRGTSTGGSNISSKPFILFIYIFGIRSLHLYSESESESESALLAKYVHTNKEFDSGRNNSQCTLNLRRK